MRSDQVMNDQGRILFTDIPECIVRWANSTALDPTFYKVKIGGDSNEVIPLTEYPAFIKKQRRDLVVLLVGEAMQKQDVATYRGESIRGVLGVADETASKILKALW